MPCSSTVCKVMSALSMKQMRRNCYSVAGVCVCVCVSFCLCVLVRMAYEAAVLAEACVLERLGYVQVETGNPYMLYKDSCNRKSNQQNLGTIKCSNLCTEIIEYTSPEESAVCNLASIALPR